MCFKEKELVFFTQTKLQFTIKEKFILFLVSPGSGVIFLPGVRISTQHRSPPSCLSLPVWSRAPRNRKRFCAGSRFLLWTACHILQPTLPHPNLPPVSPAAETRDQRWLDGYRRVLWTAAQGEHGRRGSVQAERGQPAVTARSFLALLLPHYMTSFCGFYF